MIYRIEYRPSVVDDDIPALPKAIRERIRRAIEEKLTRDPVAFGKPLQYNLNGVRSLRVGDYRVLFVVEGDLVTVVTIGDRKNAYG
jgi:mRNA interferase RelE/StbE